MSKELRVFLGARGNTVLGAICNKTDKTATSKRLDYTSNQEKINRVQREALLTVLNDTLKSIDLRELNAPVQIFVADNLSKAILKQTYKFWAYTGIMSDGSKIDETELALWKEFNTLMSKKGHMIIIRDLYEANFKGTPKFDVENIKYNKFYFDWIISSLEKIMPVKPATPEPAEPESV